MMVRTKTQQMLIGSPGKASLLASRCLRHAQRDFGHLNMIQKDRVYSGPKRSGIT